MSRLNGAAAPLAEPEAAPSRSTPDSAGGIDEALRDMPGHHVRRLQQVAVRLFAEEVGSDLTPVQYAALIGVARRPGLAQAPLAALIGYDRATIGGVIDRLEQKGWLMRSPSPADRRVNTLTVTRKGEEALARAAPAVARVQARLTQPLDEAERADFTRMCIKMLAHHGG